VETERAPTDEEFRRISRASGGSWTPGAEGEGGEPGEGVALGAVLDLFLLGAPAVVLRARSRRRKGR